MFIFVPLAEAFVQSNMQIMYNSFINLIFMQSSGTMKDLRSFPVQHVVSSTLKILFYQLVHKLLSYMRTPSTLVEGS